MVSTAAMRSTPSRLGPTQVAKRLGLFAGVLAISALFSAGACSTQNEGERCERKNGNNDCAEGLICKSGKDLGGNADICCPTGASDNPECNPGAGTTSSTTGETGSTTGDTTSGSTSASTSGSTSASTSASTTASSSSGGGGGGAGGATASSTGTM